MSIQINQTFNSWKVLEIKGYNLLCLCLSCNQTTKLIRKNILIQGKSKKCSSCQKSPIKIDDQFGFWKILTLLPDYKTLCLCTGCNITQKEMRKSNLLRLASRSCGCQMQSLIQTTNLKNLGTHYPTQSKKVKEKVKETLLKNYQVDNPSKSPLLKEKKKKTSISNYGADHYLKTKEGQEVRKKTNLEKYGSEHYSQTEEYIQKVRETCQERYGVESYSQLPENRNKLKQWCEENPGFNGTSKGELEILSFIQQYYPQAKKFKKEGNELDIFIPEINLGIEFNGLYWHSEINKPNSYHLDKTNYFKALNIRTVHIFEHEWMRREKQVKSFLLSAINKNEHKIGARKCKIIWSASKEEIKKAHQLLDSTHIQGHTSSTKFVANVYYNNDLLATATFGKHHRNNNEWVLTRFTTKVNYTIQGILSKISKLASKKLDSDIISWADYRLSDGNGYEKAGWIKEKLLPPDYFYFKGLRIISKQSRQKKNSKYSRRND